jgi:hypothetical protein
MPGKNTWAQIDAGCREPVGRSDVRVERCPDREECPVKYLLMIYMHDSI